jgi:hypothetical protein
MEEYKSLLMVIFETIKLFMFCENVLYLPGYLKYFRLTTVKPGG